MILLLHASSALFMTGVIWFVQVVHYPLFERVGSRFGDYAHEHSRRTTPIVAPVMILELISGVILAWSPAPEVAAVLRINAGLLVVTWLSTFVLQVPLHRRLQDEGDPSLVGRLVASNWVRTLCWSARSVLLVWMLATPVA